MAIVFISYRTADRAQAERLTADLRKREHEVYIDFAELEAGDSIPSKLAALIEAADVVLDCASKHGPSKWKTREVDHALMREKTIIPVVLTGGEHSGFSRTPSRIDLTQDWELGIQALLRALERSPPAPKSASPWRVIAERNAENALVKLIAATPEWDRVLDELARSLPHSNCARSKPWRLPDRESALLRAFAEICAATEVALTPHEAALLVGAMIIGRALESRAQDEPSEAVLTSNATIAELCKHLDPHSASAAQDWLRARELRQQRTLWSTAQIAELLGPAALSRELFPAEVISVLARGSTAPLSAIPELEEPRRVPLRGTTHTFRDRTLAMLAYLGERSAIEPADLPDTIVHHVGRRFALSVDDVGKDLERCHVRWTKGLDVSIHARCDHASIDLCLTELARELDEVLRGPARVVEAALSLPPGCRADVEPRIANGKAKYEKPLVTFTMETHDVRELLMGMELWTDPKFAYRELYQNALDACRYRSCRADYLGVAYSPRIEFYEGKTEDGRAYAECQDNGIGMTLELLRDCFARAGRRFASTAEFLREKAEWNTRGISMTPNSQFGIGVFSYFMVAEEIEIETCRSNPKDDTEGARFLVSIPAASSHFRVQRLEPAEAIARERARLSARGDTQKAKLGPGTVVRLYLRPGDRASCIDTLEALVWFTDVDVRATATDRQTEWKAGELSPKLEGYAQRSPGERRLWWIAEPEKQPRPIHVQRGFPGDPGTRPLRSAFRQHFDPHARGLVLVDGIATELELAATIVNLEGEHQARLSVDRRRLRDPFPLELVERWVAEALSSLPPAERMDKDTWFDFFTAWPHAAVSVWRPELFDSALFLRNAGNTRSRKIAEAWLGDDERRIFVDREVVERWRAQPLSPVVAAALLLSRRGSSLSLPDLLAIEAWTGIERTKCAVELVSLSELLGWKAPVWTNGELELVGPLTASDHLLLAIVLDKRNIFDAVSALRAWSSPAIVVDTVERIGTLLGRHYWTGDRDALRELFANHRQLAEVVRREIPWTAVMALKSATSVSRTFAELARNASLVLRAITGEELACPIEDLTELTELDRSLISAAVDLPVAHIAGDALAQLIIASPNQEVEILDRASVLSRALGWTVFELDREAFADGVPALWSSVLGSYRRRQAARVGIAQMLVLMEVRNFDVRNGARMARVMAKVFGFEEPSWDDARVSELVVTRGWYDNDARLLRLGDTLAYHNASTVLLELHANAQVDRYNEVASAFSLPQLDVPEELLAYQAPHFELLTHFEGKTSWVGGRATIPEMLGACVNFCAPAWALHDMLEALAAPLDVHPPEDDASYLGITWKEIVDRSRVEHASYGAEEPSTPASEIDALLAQAIVENDAKRCGQFAIDHPELRDALDAALEALDSTTFEKLLESAARSGDAGVLASITTVETFFLAASRRMAGAWRPEPAIAAQLFEALRRGWRDGSTTERQPTARTRRLEDKPSSWRRWWAACWTWSFALPAPETHLANASTMLFPGWSEVSLARTSVAPSFPSARWRDEQDDPFDGLDRLFELAPSFVARCQDPELPERLVPDLLLPAIIAISKTRAWTVPPAFLDELFRASALDTRLANAVEELPFEEQESLLRAAYRHHARENPLFAFRNWRAACPRFFERCSPRIDHATVESLLTPERMHEALHVLDNIPLHLVVPLVRSVNPTLGASHEHELVLAISNVADPAIRESALEVIAPSSREARRALWATSPKVAEQHAAESYARREEVAREWFYLAPKEYRETSLHVLESSGRIGPQWANEWLDERIGDGGPLAERAHALRARWSRERS